MHQPLISAKIHIFWNIKGNQEKYFCKGVHEFFRPGRWTGNPKERGKQTHTGKRQCSGVWRRYGRGCRSQVRQTTACDPLLFRSFIAFLRRRSGIGGGRKQRKNYPTDTYQRRPKTGKPDQESGQRHREPLSTCLKGLNLNSL